MNEKCKCGSILIFTETPNLTHYARLDCPEHGFIKWISNPENIRRRTQTSKFSIRGVMFFHKFKGKPFCFFCLRKRNQLGIKETLTIDHIQELNEKGKDVLENLQILCTACHKLKNWARLYVNWHLKEIYIAVN